MSDTDARIAALLREERPAARDSRFRLGVLEALARRRLRARLAWVLVAGGGVTAGLAAMAPGLTLSTQGLVPNSVMAGAGFSLAILLTLWGVMQARRPI